ncbi:anti-sigma factor [Acidithiobacillus montserratensis]|uniref:Anti-sigma factor n=1 Tax=Acidithiobacillus montserratensis TaxID=2729135 RepID=A0ACD5HIQ8_9PROT|nr:anti-sigma factor [Acidithiobacillaceae bacterium]
MHLNKWPKLADSLAGAYVLGTLRGRARLRFTRMLRAYPWLAARVAEWEDILMPYSLPQTPLAPPRSVWHGVAAQLPKRPTPVPAWWQKAGLWRALSAGLALAVVLLLVWPAPPAMPYMAVLNNTAGQPVWMLRANRHHMALVTMRSMPVPADKSLQLWAIVPGKKPISMGLLPTRPGRTPILLTPDHLNMRTVALIAVTMEPAGGSPTGQPTSAVLYKADILSTQLSS